MSGLIQDLLEINRRLSFELWHITTIKDKPRGLSPRMLLPTQVEGDIRIGEHEPMILYCGLLNGLSYYYLTENPSEMSASSDLNLFAFRDNSFVKVAGVEFKAHNPGEEIIRQDVRKLVKDKVTGNWFHILEDFDPDTIKDLFAKLTKSLRTCADSLNDDQLSILFCFCILEKQWTCIKHFYYDRSRGDFDTYVENFFDLDCVVESHHIVVSKGLDWYIFQLYTEGFLGN
ncbi:MAG: hypothetical protein JSV47_10590 [Deltaproteobacteria bacterium]|nr:MAG: hypothetical protein JSV47_10590 [Deltaproteobacteria bacterium]